jgi:hypothetical protein
MIKPGCTLVWDSIHPLYRYPQRLIVPVLNAPGIKQAVEFIVGKEPLVWIHFSKAFVKVMRTS